MRVGMVEIAARTFFLVTCCGQSRDIYFVRFKFVPVLYCEYQGQLVGEARSMAN